MDAARGRKEEHNALFGGLLKARDAATENMRITSRKYLDHSASITTTPLRINPSAIVILSAVLLLFSFCHLLYSSVYIEALGKNINL